MLYKYTFYKLYKWARVGLDEQAIYPHLGAIFLLTLLFLSNAYLILVMLDKMNICKFNGDFIHSPSAKILIAVFVSMYLFNHLYFLWINKWKEIVIYFKNNNVSSKIKLLANIYIGFSVLSFLIIYLFNL